MKGKKHRSWDFASPRTSPAKVPSVLHLAMLASDLWCLFGGGGAGSADCAMAAALAALAAAKKKRASDG